ncbi:hypothetical protein CE91St36_21760 [Christensenellaceae bacterium]|nr:hypothetical protein CE91St36_21760 [Christensenellaceae bacterium]
MEVMSIILGKSSSENIFERLRKVIYSSFIISESSMDVNANQEKILSEYTLYRRKT